MEAAAEFFAAVDRGDLPALQRLLGGSPLLIRSKLHGATALHRAAARGDSALIEFLLERGAPVDEPDELGASALSWATEEAQDAAVDLLLARGAKASAVDLAARGCHVELGRLLDDAPWRIAEPSCLGSALQVALRRGRVEAARLLIARGADLEARDEQGLTALELARRIANPQLLVAIERRLAGREAPGGGTSRGDEQVCVPLSYRCGACAEEIIIEVDRTAGDEQRFVEDCPVCCRANVIEVRFERGGGVACAELE